MKTIIAVAWLAVAAAAQSAFGQLILTGPDSTNVPCGTPVTLTASVEETNGLAVIVTWWLNDVAVQTNAVDSTTNPPTLADFTLAGVFPAGTNLVDVVAENSDGLMVTNSAVVIEEDTNPPVIVSAAPSQSSLWPPNHKMVKITVSAVVTDDCSTPTWKIIGVKSNEAANAKGSGNTAVDWQIAGDHCVYLRAERAGPGSGRVYTISLQAMDSVGNLSATNTITVTVPHDQGKGKGGNAGNDNSGDNGKGNGNGKGKGNK
jgi:hypothetical protein